MLNELQTIAERVDYLRRTLPDTVRLIAVSKTVPPEKIRQAYAAGLRDFGENRVQEALSKQAELADLPDITWHLLGHLQSNKATKAVEHFHWIHSVDSLKLAQRLDQVASTAGQSPQLCLQVKLRPDPNKSGWDPQALADARPELAALQNLKISGLMTIPPQHSNSTETLKIFQETQALAQQFNPLSPIQFRELSMGMSEDYPIALQAGSTMIRLGRILFGERQR